MKNIKIFGLFLVLSVVVLFTSCKKEIVNRMNSIPIALERIEGDGKAYIDGLYACWEDGDAIRITRNGTTNYDGSISISYPSGAPVASATASGFETAADEVVSVAYPQSLFSTCTIASSTNVTLPNEYAYVTTNGRQKIVSPMMGQLTIQSYESGQENPNVLKLTSLCCLLKIELNKPTSGAFVLDEIQVVNTTKSTPMSGSGTVTFVTSGTKIVPELAMTGDASTNNTVTLNLHSNAVAINETKYFYVPIPPQDFGQNFTIRIHNQLTNSWHETKIFSNQNIPGNSVAPIIGPSTNDATVPFTFYDWLYNHTSGSSARINLGEYLTATTKTEITFVQMADPTANQGYTGARQDAAPNKVYYSITGFSNSFDATNSFAAQFMGQSIVTDGGLHASRDDFNTTTRMSRVIGTKYRHTFEVKSDADGYYGDATFEQLDNITSEVGCNNSIITGRTKSTTWDNGCNSAPIYVFGFGPTNNPGMKLYSYRFWQNGSLSHNFVPARRTSDNHIGVYDMATSTFIDCGASTLSGSYYQGTYFRIGND